MSQVIVLEGYTTPKYGRHPMKRTSSKKCSLLSYAKTTNKVNIKIIANIFLFEHHALLDKKIPRSFLASGDFVSCFCYFNRVYFYARFSGTRWVTFGDGEDNIHSLCDFAKDGVLIIEMRRGAISDEELAAIRSGSGVCHRENAGTLMPK